YKRLDLVRVSPFRRTVQSEAERGVHESNLADILYQSSLLDGPSEFSPTDSEDRPANPILVRIREAHESRFIYDQCAFDFWYQHSRVPASRNPNRLGSDPGRVRTSIGFY